MLSPALIARGRMCYNNIIVASKAESMAGLEAGKEGAVNPSGGTTVPIH